MTQTHYSNPEEYRAAQIEGNTRKIHRVWALERNIRWLAKNVVPEGARFGICHGTRRGAEQAWFRKYLPGCEVIGTEISPSALDFPDTLCWDFSKPLVSGTAKADFVYSNSHDHARDPKATIRLWLSQLRPGGVLILEHTDYHEQLTDYNCWAVSSEELAGLLAKWSGHGVATFDLPAKHGYLKYCRAVVGGV